MDSGLSLVLPLPPSANHLFANRRRGGRVKTQDYRDWLAVAGWVPLEGRWGRLVPDGAPTGTLWTLDLLATGLSFQRDLTNLIKPVEDLVCQMTGLDDRYNLDTHAQRHWVPWHGPVPRHAPAIYLLVIVIRSPAGREGEDHVALSDGHQRRRLPAGPL